MSVFSGILRLKVVMKNPTPALLFGKPSDKDRSGQRDVSNPGRCQP